MNVNDDSSSPATGGSLLDDLYEHSLRLYSYMAQALHHNNDQNAPADSPPSSSSNTESSTEFDFHTLMSQPYRIETLASSCALFICILIYAICHVRPDSICSKYLRYVNVLAVFTLLITALGSCFKFLVKTPENVEIQISSDNSGAYSMQGRRGGMEDRFTLKNSIASELGMEFYAVYDGHGGPNAAAYAEKELFNRITRRVKLLITEPTSTENPVSKLKARTPLKEVKNLLTRMTSDVSRFDLLNVNDLKNIINDEVISFDEKLVNEFTAKQDISGTTALIVVRIVKTNTLLVANVGDSRAILCDWKNATIPLSFDHKPDKLKEYRRVMEAGGHIILRGVFRVNGILAVSRALGDYPLKNNRIVIPDPDILTFDLDDLRPRFMIIASDGFWDTFSNENAVQYVKNELTHYGTNYVAKGSGSLAIQIAKKLAQESYNRESYDNITVIVVLFEEQDGKARVGIAKKTK